jgi:hypothetical protein
VLSVAIRSLRREFRVHCPSGSVAAAIAFVTTKPDIAGQSLQEIDLSIEEAHGFLRLRQTDGAVHEGSARYLQEILHAMHFNAGREELPKLPLIRCGVTCIADEYLLLASEAGAGMTTLLTSLAASGWAVPGTEYAYCEGNSVIPFPQPLKVRLASLAHLSQYAAERIRSLPSTVDWHRTPVFAVEPSSFGRRWVIERRVARHIVVLRGNHGGQSQLRRIDWQSALEALLRNAILPHSGRSDALGKLRALVSLSRCFELWHGTLDRSTYLLGEMAKRIETLAA